MIHKLINTILGDPNVKEVKRIRKKVALINQVEEQLEQLSDEQLQLKTVEFKERITKGESLDDILVEAFAVVKNACRRIRGRSVNMDKQTMTWDMIPYDVQLLGGIVLHEGKIAEMKTGEGKTLVACLPVYLNALAGRGVHVITVNDYLAKRDALWMSLLYEFLGLSVGVIVHGLTQDERRAAYQADITYGTNNEFGFDYLRDNMSPTLEACVQRELFYTIVDEVDSILIDEARTPLIISSPAEESTSKYMRHNQLIRQLIKDTHYQIDEKMRTAILTEEGIKKMEELLGVQNIYTDSGFEEVHHIEQALKAQAIFKKDIDYVVRDEEVVIVDEFTGRLMPGRRYSDGLHQAIEAKEGVAVKRESRTLATITFQNYFRLYEKLAGMTGTAVTEAEEFLHIYKLETVVIPTHRDITREDKADAIYKSEKGKFLAIVNQVKEKHAKGQPVLIGTISIEKSEILANLLSQMGVPHNVLNAKQHQREAEIVAQAGQRGAVTIATNMAGRGTDIKLGEGVKDLGGLAIFGTERHESRRIDNQLRGRSGRQGDPGETQFFISMEDSLMRLFGGERIQKMMQFLNIPEDVPIENGLISKSIESAQKKVEGHHFDVRKHLVEYDDIMNRHRIIIYSKRKKILQWQITAGDSETEAEIQREIRDLLQKEVSEIVNNHCQERNHVDWDYAAILADIEAIHKDPEQSLELTQLEMQSEITEMVECLYEYLEKAYQKKEKQLPDPRGLRQIEKAVYLRTIDTLWMEHIDSMSQLREKVALRGYGQRDPLIEYKNEAYIMFQRLLSSIHRGTIHTLFKMEINVQPADLAPRPKPQVLQTNEEDIENQITRSHISPKEVQTIKTQKPINAPKVGRNDDCSCGSGKKYKKCCGREE